MSVKIGDKVKNIESSWLHISMPLFGTVVNFLPKEYGWPEYIVLWENGLQNFCYDYELVVVSDEEYQAAKKQEEEFVKSLKDSKHIAVAEPVEEYIQPDKPSLYNALETLKDHYREKIRQIEQMQKDIKGERKDG